MRTVREYPQLSLRVRVSNDPYLKIDNYSTDGLDALSSSVWSKCYRILSVRGKIFLTQERIGFDCPFEGYFRDVFGAGGSDTG